MEEAWELAVVSKRIKVSLGGQELEYETDQAALKAVGKVLNDIISPVSEGFGALGDKIRVYRAKSLEDTLTEAKEIANERGVKLENVPPKFMIQWAEGASAENTDTQDNLQTLWANLLVNVAENKTALGSGYISIVKQLDKRHAQLLSVWAAEAIEITNLEGFMHGLIPSLQFDSVQRLATVIVRELENKFNVTAETSLIDSGKLKEVQSLFEECRKNTNKFGVEVAHLKVNGIWVPTSCYSSGEETDLADDFDGISDSAYLDRDFLARLGLLSSRMLEGKTLDGLPFTTNYYGINSLGVSFVESVSPTVASSD